MSTFLDLIKQSPRGSILDEISGLIDWGIVGRKLKRILLMSKMGRPAYDPLKMFRLLLLQRLYDLSDPEMEHQLYDRLSFRRFCGFGMSEALPDETTICRFRLSLLGKTESLFDLILDQIDRQGLLLRKGTLIDASIIQANTKAPRGGEQSEVDPEAGWTCKNDEYTYGYKAHIGVDEGSGIVVKAKTTSAEVHDSQAARSVITGQEDAVYGDKAYDGKELRNELKQAGIRDRILYKKPKGKTLGHWKKVLNKLYSKIRCGVERVFAHWKGQHGYIKARYWGWEKNQLHLDLLCMAYNLKRACGLVKKQNSLLNAR